MTERRTRNQNQIIDYYGEQPRQLPALSQKNFVPAIPTRRNIQRPAANNYMVDVPLASTQHIEMRTNAVDRAKGFLLSNIPLLVAFALGVSILRVTATGAPFWTLTTLAWFWTTFVLAWLLSYAVTLMLSAEGIAFYESYSKWKLLEREQENIWSHYDDHR